MPEKRKAEHELFKGTKDLADATLGDVIGKITFTIAPEMADRIAFAMDDYNPWYMQDSPFGGRIASPTAALPFDGAMFYDYYKYPAGGSLFAKQEFEFVKPIKLGETYTMTGTLVDTYKKRGRSFFKMGVSVTDKSGVEVMRMAKTVATPVKPVLEEGAAS
jgi:acyl dehydratase